MTSIAIPKPSTSGVTRQALSSLAEYARTAETPAILDELSIKTRAARELADLQDDADEIRRLLMHVDVAILMRRAELGEKLHARGVAAVKVFTDVGPERVAEFIESHGTDYGKASSLLLGLAAKIKADDEAAHGESFALRPTYARPYSEPTAEQVREQLRASLAADLHGLVAAYTELGQPFTVDQVTDDLLDYCNDVADSDRLYRSAFRDGVRRMCREAVRNASTVRYDGKALPDAIAVYAPREGWVRIPLANATPAHLSQTISVRLEAIQRDQDAVDNLTRFRDSLTAAGCREDEQISSYLPEVTR